MAVTTAYLTSTKNLEGIFNAILSAQAPKQFTQKFLENLGYTGNADRLIIAMLKALGFLDAGGTPTQRYYRFLDQSESAKVLAEGIREAYDDLFAINVNAQSMTRVEIKNKLKTLTQGRHSDAVLDKMAMTFLALSSKADFSDPTTPVAGNQAPAYEDEPAASDSATAESPISSPQASEQGAAPVRLGGLVYNIELVLPDTRDQAVYDALFRSLRTHLTS